MEAGQGFRYPYPLLPPENAGCCGVNSTTGEKRNEEAALYHHDASWDCLMHLARSARGGRPGPPLPLSVLESQSAPAENVGCCGANSRTGEKRNQEAPLVRGVWGVGTLNLN